MEFGPNSQPELTILTVEGYLEQLDLWEKEGMDKMRSGKRVLDHDWEQKLRDSLVERARTENPVLISVIMAQYSVSASVVGQETKSSPVGNQMNGTDISVTGHISESTLWLFDNKENSIQTMVRLAVQDQDGGKKLVDVYSKPVHPGLTKKDGARSINVQATEVSRVRNLLNYIEATKSEVLGWIRIPEITEQKIPSYS